MEDPRQTAEWLCNNAPLNFETGSTLTLENVQTSRSGTYRVVVANAAHSITSAPAILSVAGAPSLSAPLSVSAGQFQLTLGGVTGHSYRVEASTNLADWVALGIYTNVGSVVITDTNSVRYPYRFYRAILLP